MRGLGIPEERHHIRPLAKRDLSEDGIDLSAESLIPELTVNRDGIYWHPFGTEEDLLLTRDMFPLRNAYEKLWERYAATVDGGNIMERTTAGWFRSVPYGGAAEPLRSRSRRSHRKAGHPNRAATVNTVAHSDTFSPSCRCVGR